MTTGELIKNLRTGNNVYGKKWSQDEIGKMLNPPVNRSAINKWEDGTIKNIKKSYIEQLAVIFSVSPAELMCFESKYNEEEISNSVKVIEQIQSLFGKDAVLLLQLFNELNADGKEKALKDLGDLVDHPKFNMVQGGSR